MADLSTPSAANIATARSPTPSNAPKEKAVPATRPERPDEEKYKEELAKAEKELRSAEERLVRGFAVKDRLHIHPINAAETRC